MKNKTIKISILLIISILCLTIGNNVEAATASLSVSSSTITVGKTVTVTINVNAGAWNLSINGGGLTSSDTSGLVGQTTTTSNQSATKSYTFTCSKTGKYTISLTGDITDYDTNETTNVNKTVTVNVEEEKIPENPTTPNSPTTPTTPTATEPKFTSVNSKVYATGDINLRSTWSTSSGATQVKKGTELTLTGKSSEKINGYVWYRVSYNGQTKYVSNSLVTETKPEETSNVNLKSLKLSVDGLNPAFKQDVTEYTLEVDNTVNDITVTAEAEDSKSAVTIEGNKELKVGENIIKITVKSEDGKSTRVYNIKVMKKEETSKLGLKTLNIKDTNMSTLFKSDIYEYDIDIKNVDVLEIEAIANVEGAKVEILGNSELKEGENIITIMVTSEDGKETATYQIKAIKKLAETNTTKTNNIIDTKVIIYASIAGAAFISLIIVIIYTIRNRNVDREEDYNYNDNLDKQNEEDNENEEYTQKQYGENTLEETQEIEQIPELKQKKETPEIDYIKQENDIYDNDNGNDDNDRPRRRRGKHF